MIETKDLATQVKFGTHEKAAIAVTSLHHTLRLQMLATHKIIQDPLKPEDIQDLPKIEMEFFCVESIDVVMEHLKRIRRNFTEPVYNYALAC